MRVPWFCIAASTFIVAVASLVAGAEPTRATWRAVDFGDSFAVDLDFVEGLLDRGLVELANEELALVEPRVSKVEDSARVRFGQIAIRAALESGRLLDASGRADVAKRLETLRALCRDDGSDDAFALALVRAYYALGALEEETSDGENESDGAYLDLSFELCKARILSLPADSARAFLYWSAKTSLARRSDSKRFETTEKFASALADASSEARDAYYFFARTLLIESAWTSGDFDLASKRLEETSKTLQTLNEPPVEFEVALVAARIRLLTSEGKVDEAVRLAVEDKLENDATRENLLRFVDVFDDPFESLESARAEAFWNAALEAPELDDASGVSNLPTKKALIQEARSASNRLCSNYWRSRASLIASAASQVDDDWSTTADVAEDAYRRANWREALDGYDRAASEASESGASDDAFRLSCAAAALVDKICRDELYKNGALGDSNPRVWQEDAQTRFERLARERLDDELAPTFFLLALDYGEKLGRDVYESRLEYLRIFPNASKIGTFALDVARRAISLKRDDDAFFALACVPTDSDVFADALELERRVVRARVESAQDRVGAIREALARFLSRLSFAGGAQNLADLLRASQFEGLTDADSLILTAYFETTFEFSQDLDLRDAALEETLDRWENAIVAGSNSSKRAETSATIRSFRLSLGLETKTPEEILALLETFDFDNPNAKLDALERLANFAETSSAETRDALALFVLRALDGAEKTSESERATLLRADASRLAGKAQDALNLYARLLKKKSPNVAALRGLGKLLSARNEPKTLERALGYWSDVADAVKLESREWWDAKEECVKLYCRLGKIEQAEKMTRVLWLTRSDPTDPERKTRWEQIIEDSKK